MTLCEHLTVKCTLCKNYVYNDLTSPKCYIHFKKKYLSSAITISRYYRGYRARRYLKIFTLLPRDLQYKIQFYIREPLILEKHYYNKIKTVLSNRFYNDDLFKLRAEPHELFEKVRKDFGTISEIYRLYNKYYIIADLLILNWLSKVVEILINLYKIYKLNNDFDENIIKCNEFHQNLINFYKLSKKIKF